MNYLATRKSVDKLFENLRHRNFIPHFAVSKEDALAKVISVIPPGSEIATASSVTLKQIGFLDLLNSKKHDWKNFRDNIFTEVDHLKRDELRRESILADYNIQSLQAITENGQLLIASGMGNQLSAIAYASRNIVFVAGLQKVVPTLDSAFERLNEFVLPLENERMKRAGFKEGATLGKYLVFEREIRPRQVHVILVGEVLGF
ncbi:lactate utilization protein [Mucilaginibacter sabulilitoris]|uniref:Lactate utilization protein n=1 Tax=Mucilaginibacter sabulilitoris TaxID=1173583 RepID=A0ABZ0U0R2_9SPHI|nr:lactate utilization protein [Mucilaginibacter sabulilitoris]WPU96970.1 lactate utilization protein [Mucilaginibacter sabulilitoris]